MQCNAAEVVPIYFTVSSLAQYTWLAHADSSDATWSTKTLYMASGGSGEFGFASSDSSTDKLTNVWWTYGRYVMAEVSDANFFAEPIAGVAGWYTLSWGVSASTGTDKTLVTLRTVAPSTDSVLA
ncbi:uncharacterized protein N7482_003395 [Penicillium canariense]|uniref:Uncharacterized protein n=1 Tax=Penicillium canariense TaxID=189055 RepID=A0A9W9LP43_9EURO|nr:uncharacterized protein N7482_003395 [Penicillium canariense]KAJ5167801.1 hypothetical protein N7482_003395 [Penicillium canariense]